MQCLLKTANKGGLLSTCHSTNEAKKPRTTHRSQSCQCSNGHRTAIKDTIVSIHATGSGQISSNVVKGRRADNALTQLKYVIVKTEQLSAMDTMTGATVLREASTHFQTNPQAPKHGRTRQLQPGGRSGTPCALTGPCRSAAGPHAHRQIQRVPYPPHTTSTRSCWYGAAAPHGTRSAGPSRRPAQGTSCHLSTVLRDCLLYCVEIHHLHQNRSHPAFILTVTSGKLKWRDHQVTMAHICTGRENLLTIDMV